MTQTPTAERITALLFDIQTPPATWGSRISSAFGLKAASPRRLTLGEAKARMISEGMSRADAALLGQAVQAMMGDEVRMLAMKRAMQEEHNIVIFNSVDWGDKYYLGVSVIDPPVDMGDEPYIQRNTRAMVLANMREWNRRAPRAQGSTPRTAPQ